MRSPERKTNTQKGCKCGFISYSTTTPLGSSPSYHVCMSYQHTATPRKHHLTLSVLYLRGKEGDKRREGKEGREEREGKGRLPEMNPRLSFCLHAFVHLYLFCSWYLRAGSVSTVRPMQPSFPFQRSGQLTVSPPLLSTPPLGSAVTSKDS